MSRRRLTVPRRKQWKQDHVRVQEITNTLGNRLAVFWCGHNAYVAPHVEPGDYVWCSQCIKPYICWKSDTCYVCRNTSNGPYYHARRDGYKPTSPCDTTSRKVYATDRRQALKLYKQGKTVAA